MNEQENKRYDIAKARFIREARAAVLQQLASQDAYLEDILRPATMPECMKGCEVLKAVRATRHIGKARCDKVMGQLPSTTTVGDLSVKHRAKIIARIPNAARRPTT